MFYIRYLIYYFNPKYHFRQRLELVNQKLQEEKKLQKLKEKDFIK